MNEALAAMSCRLRRSGRWWFVPVWVAALVAFPCARAAAQDQERSTQAVAGNPQDEDASDQAKEKDQKEPKEKKKKEPVKFVIVPHPGIRVGKLVRIDFRGRIMQEGNRSP